MAGEPSASTSAATSASTLASTSASYQDSMGGLMSFRDYINQSVLTALLRGLTAVAKERPPDPLKYLAEFLLKYRRSQEERVIEDNPEIPIIPDIPDLTIIPEIPELPIIPEIPELPIFPQPPQPSTSRTINKKHKYSRKGKSRARH